MKRNGTLNSRPKHPDRACVMDGESNPACLKRHSIGGFEVTLCRRCYLRLVERRTHPLLPIWAPPDDLELIGRVLLEEADVLSLLAQSRWMLGHALLDRVRKDAPDMSEEST